MQPLETDIDQDEFEACYPSGLVYLIDQIQERYPQALFEPGKTRESKLYALGIYVGDFNTTVTCEVDHSTEPETESYQFLDTLETYSDDEEVIVRVCERESQHRQSQPIDPATPKSLSLKELRLTLNRSQAELATRLGIDPTAVSRVESRRYPLLKSIADYVGALEGKLELHAVFGDRRIQLRYPG